MELLAKYGLHEVAKTLEIAHSTESPLSWHLYPLCLVPELVCDTFCNVLLFKMEPQESKALNFSPF